MTGAGLRGSVNGVKGIVPVIIGRRPRESKHNLTAGTVVIHWFWR